MAPFNSDEKPNGVRDMKQQHFILGAAIAAALATAPTTLLARQLTPAGTGFGQVSRVTQTINDQQLFTIPKSHLAFLAHAPAPTPLADTVRLNHLQLVLKPSPLAAAAMEQMITSQHNPKSAQFQKWMTPQQFGATYGLSNSDIAAVTSWLSSQGFTVNNVYPNKLQIDFSGTVGQVNKAFHTTENVYTMTAVSQNGTSQTSRRMANVGNISIPAALKNVVAGVMGLSNFHAEAYVKAPGKAKWDPAKKAFVNTQAASSAGAAPKAGSKGQAIGFADGSMRLLVPEDMATMYGINTIRANGVTGAGITIAVVENQDMNPQDWTNFVNAFGLSQYGGTFNLINPAPTSGPNNCVDPSVQIFGESSETILDSEWATAMAPGANVEVASCSDYTADFSAYTTDNFFGGVYLASVNLINAGSRPDIISASYGYGEYYTDAASKTAIDLMWAQADAEGISVFVSTGDSGSNPSYNGWVINGGDGNTGVDANSLATSPHVTAVGGTDLADYLDHTTSKYFAPTADPLGGSVLSYVPEIPWNQSCGNGVAAKAAGYSSVVAFCQAQLSFDPNGFYLTSEAGSGGPSSIDAKPAWQRQVFGAAPDQSRDLPDVSLFAGSYRGVTWAVICDQYYPCQPTFNVDVSLFSGGTSLAAPMFAGIQALMDQGLANRGMPADQGNAAPTLYALAAKEYGGATGTAPATLAACNADNGTNGTANCVFHNVTRGSISTQCLSKDETYMYGSIYQTANCYNYGSVGHGMELFGLTTTDAAPTGYTTANKAFGAQPGWSFASGLGSVDARNLLIAWRAFVNAPPAAVVTSTR